ncbi:uncharacterized protein LOC126577856 [Anopheles aquasalis]|uniref:uncharacterized protein LOC126577856 n=1 Tax=Anopheles aquasalis TaxID=42839 RepID=UPI00215A2E7B|nr:uncharacterized protein LOC126577856 [Anopheles aquasalis]
MEIVDVTRVCRLCMGDPCTPATAGINLLNFPDIRFLVKDHYSVEILPTDKCTTSICMECYTTLLKRNELRLKYKSYKKRFRMNQLILRGQIEAFGKAAAKQKPASVSDVPAGVATEDPTEVTMVETPETATAEVTPAVVENANESLEEPITEEQFEAQVANAQAQEAAPTPAVESEPQEEAREDSDTVTERSDDTIDEHVASARLDLLRPVIVDCLKEPLYLEALKPVFLSKDPDRSLDYHCPKCFQIFTKKNYLYKHRKRNSCSPSCQYCKAVINTPNHPNHDCPSSRRFAAIAGQIWAKSRYRSDASDAPSTVRESDAESEASTIDLPMSLNVETTR